MIENGWVLTVDDDMERMTGRDHWNNDRTEDMVINFSVDKDFYDKALAWFLGVEPGKYDRDAMQQIFENLPELYEKHAGLTQVGILTDYIEFNNLQSKFDEWYEER